MKPAVIPFKKFSEDILAIIVSPNNANEKYSGALNLSANLARYGEIVTNAKQLINQPITEAIVEALRAFAACPFFTKGYPSKHVAAEAGVPGVFKSIADIEPP